MERVRHAGRETAYREAGTDRERSVDHGAVLYVHGSGGTHRLWGNQYAPSGPVHPAVALDLSGHGESDDVETKSCRSIELGRPALDAYARDVIAVANETGATVLAGNSLGGAVVLWVALETDFDPDALVLAGTGAKLAVSADIRELLADDFERAITYLHGEDRFFHDASERTVGRSGGQLRATGQAVTERDFLTCHAFDIRDRLDEIAAPTLAVVGEFDELTPPAYHEYLVEHVQRGEYAEVPGAAHLAMVERPSAFNDAVARFLDATSLDDR